MNLSYDRLKSQSLNFRKRKKAYMNSSGESSGQVLKRIVTKSNVT
jgi:hypothetical protein